MSKALYLFATLLFVIEASEVRYTQVSPGHFSSSSKPSTSITSLTPSTSITSLTPSTSSSKPSTTTPPMTTTPKRRIVYFVNDSSEVCILLMADVKVILKQENNPNSTKEVIVDINEAEAEGKCRKNNENIILSFFKDWKLEFLFSEVNKNYYISMVKLHYNTDNFPAKLSLKPEKGDIIKHNITEFGNQEGQSYVCDSGLNVSSAIGGVWNYTLTAEIRNFQVEAYRHNATSTNFSTDGLKNCVNPSVNNLIPIIVGSVLIVLILVVLVAYLISRRKRRTGYESV